jgi:hypothetical protein
VYALETGNVRVKASRVTYIRRYSAAIGAMRTPDTSDKKYRANGGRTGVCRGHVASRPLRRMTSAYQNAEAFGIRFKLSLRSTLTRPKVLE